MSLSSRQQRTQSTFTKSTPTPPRRSGVLGFVLATLLVLIGAASVAGYALLPHGDTIARGVSVRGIALGNLSKTAAESLVARTLAGDTAKPITLNAGNFSRVVTLHEAGIEANTTQAVAQALSIGREGTLATRLFEAGRARWFGKKIAPSFTLDEERARAVLTDFGREIDQPAVDASAHWDADTKQVVITPDRPGAKLDETASPKLLKGLLADLKIGRPVPNALALPYREKIPHVTTADLTPIDTVIGTYTTSYASSSANRVKNVVTAATAMNHVFLKPGATFSFNQIVGPRDSASGFREAPVIINGQLKEGIGGGVCQVSTTLYNAVLRANLAIVQRNHHSLPSHYVGPGQDATVSYGALDFRFKNTTDTPIVIESASEKRHLTVRILGKGPAPVVHIVASNIHPLPGHVITHPDPTLPKGTRVVDTQGTAGLAVTVTRVIGVGPDAKREFISTDKYIGEPTIVRVGTGPPATDAPAGDKTTPTPADNQ